MTMKSIEGQRVPEVVFKLRDNDEWREATSADIFAGRKVVLFALPGAFTPTCSASHLPRYNELVPTFREHGIDEVICVSVNDAFVMEAWQRDQGADRVFMLADGNADFTTAMGMLVDKRDLGFGPRSWRYSMLVDDGVIERMFIEPDKPGDPFEVSDADTMLQHVAPGVAQPAPVTIFSKPGCPHCARAKRLLREQSIGCEEIVLGRDATVRSVRAVAGADTVPQVFMDGVRIGGADELQAYLDKRRAA